MENKIHTEIIGEDNIDDQVDLYNKVFKKKATVESWRHKHYDNPLNTNNILGVGAFDGHRLIGMEAFMPLKYIFKQHIFNAIQSCELAVDPNYRGRGIAMQLKDKAIPYYIQCGYDLMVGYPNEQSYFVDIKAEMNHIINIKTAFIICKINKILKDRYNLKLPNSINIIAYLKFMAVKKNAIKYMKFVLNKSNKAFSDRECQKMQINNSNLISLYISEDILNWQLNDNNGIYYTITSEDQLIAQFIVKLAVNQSSIVEASIIKSNNYTNNSSEYICAYSLMLKDLFMDCDVIKTWVPQDTKEKDMLKKIGFLSFRQQKYHSLLFRILANDNDLCTILQNKSLWNPELIEVDTIINL